MKDLRYYDDEYGEPCEHIKALRQYLEDHGLTVFSEEGEPQRWVNVSCAESTHFTYEGMLQPDNERQS